jgi:hypothetical protein
LYEWNIAELLRMRRKSAPIRNIGTTYPKSSQRMLRGSAALEPRVLPSRAI